MSDRQFPVAGEPEWAVAAVTALLTDDGESDEWISMIQGEDVNSIVRISYASESSFLSGSFGDRHQSVFEFEAEATLLAIIAKRFPKAVSAAVLAGADPAIRSASLRQYSSQDLKDSDEREEIKIKDFLPVHMYPYSDADAGRALLLRGVDDAAVCGEFEYMYKSHLYCGNGERRSIAQCRHSDIIQLMLEVKKKASYE